MGSLHIPPQHLVSCRLAERAAMDADLPPALAAAWRCDLSDDSLSWTAGVFDLFGIPQGERVDRREIVGMYCEESRELLDRLRAEAIATCGSFTFEARIHRRDGEMRWMRVTADVEVKNGRATHLYGMKQDITGEMASPEA
ncbi:PAS domain-containing protein [Sphingomonas sp. LB-2]|uniref:PAS domain-containing protein n=1 Tax=Sphingomonas caeni TaxID=2984949 RepID=UPI0022305CE1|nr:PAS domain-containing protein [Sphingomonas caeni]MCW3845746.1 PAS domain-containing protein [Sphingomonas caeni]